MDIIQIGSMAILQKWLLLGIAVLFGLLFMKIWLLRYQKEENKKQFELLTNTLFIGFFIWKGSLFLFEPTLIWKSPFSLLYFTGGSNGLVLAVILSIIYFIYKAKRKNISTLMMAQTGFVFSCAVISFYHILSFIFREEISHLLLGFVTILILIISIMNRYRLTAKWIFSSVMLFSFINLIFSFILIDMGNKLFLFTAEQWLYIILIIADLIFWDKELS